jgi:hypothetical protein
VPAKPLSPSHFHGPVTFFLNGPAESGVGAILFLDISPIFPNLLTFAHLIREVRDGLLSFGCSATNQPDLLSHAPGDVLK